MIGGAYFAAVYFAGVVSVVTVVPPPTSVFAIYASQSNKTSGLLIHSE